MTEKPEMLVFKEYRPYLRILATLNSENFHNITAHQIIGNIQHAVCVTIMFTAMTTVVVLCCWYCIENGLNILILSDTMPIILSLAQMLLTRVSLMMKNRFIRKTIEQLQKIVDESEFVLVETFWMIGKILS